jgi:hypothetical protein
MSSIVRAAAAALIGCGLATFGAADASAACKAHSHTAKGSASGIQSLASISAKYAWKSVVLAHDGSAYDTWYKAANKRVTCRKEGPGKTWVCVARARPCN